MMEDKVFGNWSISNGRLVNQKQRYEIDVSRLAEIRSDGTSEWALHMIEKEWCAMEEFIPAMQFALSNIPNSIDWEETSQALQSAAYDMIIDQEAARRTGTDRSFEFSDLDMLEEETRLLKRVGWRPVRL
jgi:hypothetical protein